MADEIRIEFPSAAALERDLEQNLKNGGVLARGAFEVREHEVRDVVLVHPVDGASLTLAAEVVWVGGAGADKSVGLAFRGFGPEVRERLRAFVAEHREAAEERHAESAAALRVHERLRGLSVAEQHRIARTGEVNERIVLERIYGKSVWEPLLRNPRLTLPEVARIAQMGSLPFPLIELIVSNPAWLTGPQVRRALLRNPRLPGEAVQKILRAMPRPELQMASKQTAYPAPVRDAARRMLRG